MPRDSFPRKGQQKTLNTALPRAAGRTAGWLTPALPLSRPRQPQFPGWPRIRLQEFSHERERLPVLSRVFETVHRRGYRYVGPATTDAGSTDVIERAVAIWHEYSERKKKRT